MANLIDSLSQERTASGPCKVHYSPPLVMLYAISRKR